MFKRASPTREMRKLKMFDSRVFRKSDRFEASYWSVCEPWWLIIDARKVGCCAFELNVDFTDDIHPDGENAPLPGSLYVATTGILPGHQGKGLGKFMKRWQIAYAHHHGFTRIVTNARESNNRMITLNEAFGFKPTRTTPDYYEDPLEPTVVMELMLEAD